ncbi:hypothetical protein GGQ73_001733 [Rhizobium skierniewicense]|uniref:Uncharacterized protein n=1 Tax=Rhizobium skierniewicense TaxID=984260 RepID=A0A7W6G1B9_9HYPH|nr:hypothetical protein [Rhizobium skierniewicense]
MTAFKKIIIALPPAATSTLARATIIAVMKALSFTM